MAGAVPRGMSGGVPGGSADALSAPELPVRPAAPGSAAVAAVSASEAGQAPLEPDIDAIVDALETRMVREIERRGGRWGGVF